MRCVAEGTNPAEATVSDAMTDELVYVFDDQDTAEQDTAEAAQMMAERKIRRLPVISREKRLVGVLSIGDVAGRTHDEDIVGQTEQDISRAQPNT